MLSLGQGQLANCSLDIGSSFGDDNTGKIAATKLAGSVYRVRLSVECTCGRDYEENNLYRLLAYRFDSSKNTFRRDSGAREYIPFKARQVRQ